MSVEGFGLDMEPRGDLIAMVDILSANYHAMRILLETTFSAIHGSHNVKF